MGFTHYLGRYEFYTKFLLVCIENLSNPFLILRTKKGSYLNFPVK